MPCAFHYCVCCIIKSQASVVGVICILHILIYIYIYIHLSPCMMYTRKSGLCCRCRLYIMYIYMFIHIYIFIYTCIYIHVYLTGLPKYKVLRFAMRLPSLCMLSNQKSGLCCRCRLYIICIYIYIHIYIYIYMLGLQKIRGVAF